MRVDTGWFNDLIRRSSFGSQRRLARKIRGRSGKPLDPAALSLMLRGKRSIQLSEARQLADLLNVPLIEVLRHAGIAMPEEGTRQYHLFGHLDSDGELHLIKDGTETVTGPAELPPDAVAVRCRTSRSQYDLLDGWVFFAEKPKPPSPDAIGRYCLASPRKLKPLACFVLRGYKPGTANLMCGFFFGALKPVENIVLDWVAPVIWVRPQQ